MINQKGGFPGALVSVLSKILDIVQGIFKLLWMAIKYIFKFEPKDNWKNFNRVGELFPSSNERIDWGVAWQYLYWCFKTVIYLIIFCFGGPLVMLIGIIYLYSTLIKKFSIRKDIEQKNETQNQL